MERQKITEEQGVHKDWYKEAKAITPEKFPEFFKKLTEGYEHDYGTICHAVAAAAIAAANAVNRSPCGGITGFQAGCIQWEIIRHWNANGYADDEPVRMVSGGDLLYPQSVYRHNTITQATADWLKKKATENLKETGGSENVRAHWKRLADGWTPLPVHE